MVETTNTATPVATGTPQDFNLQVLNTDYGANTNLESMTASADQVFADFVGSYTPEQQQVIFDEISVHLYATQGNCTIRWHGVGEDKKDYVRTTYSDGQLIEFEMRNRDVSNRQSQDSRIVFQTDNKEAYLKYQEKVKNAAGKNKKAAQVEIDSDGLNLKGRQSASSSSLGLSGAQHSKQSQSSQLIRDDVAGTTNIKNTQNKMEAHADLSGVHFGYERTSNSMEFDADGNPLAAADSRTSVDAGTSGFSATASGSNTTYDADGGRHTSGYNAGLAFNGDGFNLNGGITYQTFDVNGIMLNETNLQAGAGMSVAGFTANFGAKSMRLDENGTLINRGFTAQALIGTGNFGANISSQTAIAYADGHQVTNGFGFGANFGSAGTNLSYNKNYRFITQEGYVLNQTEAGFAAGYAVTANGLSLQYSHTAKEMTAGILTRNNTSSYMANLSTGHIDLKQTITDEKGFLRTKGLSLSARTGPDNEFSYVITNETSDQNGEVTYRNNYAGTVGASLPQGTDNADDTEHDLADDYTDYDLTGDDTDYDLADDDTDHDLADEDTDYDLTGDDTDYDSVGDDTDHDLADDDTDYDLADDDENREEGKDGNKGKAFFNIRAKVTRSQTSGTKVKGFEVTAGGDGTDNKVAYDYINEKTDADGKVVSNNRSGGLEVNVRDDGPSANAFISSTKGDDTWRRGIEVSGNVGDGVKATLRTTKDDKSNTYTAQVSTDGNGGSFAAEKEKVTGKDEKIVKGVSATATLTDEGGGVVVGTTNQYTNGENSTQNNRLYTVNVEHGENGGSGEISKKTTINGTTTTTGVSGSVNWDGDTANASAGITKGNISNTYTAQVSGNDTGGSFAAGKEKVTGKDEKIVQSVSATATLTDEGGGVVVGTTNQYTNGENSTQNNRLYTVNVEHGENGGSGEISKKTTINGTTTTTGVSGSVNWDSDTANASVGTTKGNISNTYTAQVSGNDTGGSFAAGKEKVTGNAEKIVQSVSATATLTDEGGGVVVGTTNQYTNGENSTQNNRLYTMNVEHGENGGSGEISKKTTINGTTTTTGVSGSVNWDSDTANASAGITKGDNSSTYTAQVSTDGNGGSFAAEKEKVTGKDEKIVQSVSATATLTDEGGGVVVGTTKEQSKDGEVLVQNNHSSSAKFNVGQGEVSANALTSSTKNGITTTTGVNGSATWGDGAANASVGTTKGNISNTYTAQASVDGVPQGEIAKTTTETTADGVNTETKGYNTNQFVGAQLDRLGIHNVSLDNIDPSKFSIDNLSNILKKDSQNASEQGNSAPDADKAKVAALMRTNSQNAGDIMEQITPENVQASTGKPENTATDTKEPTSTIPLQRGGGYDSYS